MLRILPLLAGLIPLVAVSTSYWIAIHTAGIPSCNPFLDGCTSVSATGRHPPASYLFKGTMLPQSIILCCYWLFNVAWLRATAVAAGQSPRGASVVGTFGVTGSLFLIIYVTFLGTEAPFYEFMRRYGVYLYFLLSVIAQILLASKILPLAHQLRLPRLIALTRLQLLLGWFPFALGALNLLLKAILEDSGPAENRIEWIFALQMQLYFLVTFFSWQETRFRISFAAEPLKPLGKSFVDV
ncbi:MAG: hypothetical protein WD448_02555 [Woeseia sp.]